MKQNLFSLTAAEQKALLNIRQAIEASADEKTLEKLCETMGQNLGDKKFVYTYAAVLCAVKNHIELAKHLFFKNVQDPFCSVIHDYLQRTGSFAFGFKVFSEASPYNGWFESRFHKQYQPGFVENAASFAEKHPPIHEGDVTTILDIGTGNGFLIENVLSHITSLYSLKKLKLVLLDPSTAMLKTAREHCQKTIHCPLEIILLEGKMESLEPDQWKQLEELKPFWFTNISLSLHHMPYTKKVPLFKKLGKLTEHILFGEVNWSDELANNSPELVYVTTKAYGLLFKDILTSPAPHKDQQAAINQFLLPEAINILKEEIDNRSDYHMTANDWECLAEETGFHVVKSTLTTKLEGHPIAFASHWQSNKKT